MSRHRAPGRRRAPGRVRRLPDGLSRSRAAAVAAKSAAGLGVVGGAAVALTIPLAARAQAATPAPASLALSRTVALDERVALDRASRSATRSAPAAVTAPSEVAPVQAEPLGVSGVKAVAKPKPKPAPEPEATSSSGTGASAPSAPVAPSGSYAGGITSHCASIGLIPTAQRLCSAVQTTFGLSSIGGYRPSADEHGTGQAVDFMISSSAQGDAIAAYVQQHAGEFNVKYVIWSQRYWPAGGSWSMMADRGSITANHYDHVHVTVNY